MPEQVDFERAWLTKLSGSLDEVAGAGVRAKVMQGSDRLSSASSSRDVIGWSKAAMERLDALVDEDVRGRIMTACACRYPKSGLQPAREKYAATGDIDLALGMLQEKFEAFLRGVLELDDELIGEIVKRGWGLAGVRKGDTIIATKIPKSGYLIEYMNEADPVKKRQYYCHCPRVRDALKSSETISATYCYCGAGYYKGIWEEILQRPVRVEVLESVLAGGEVCKVAVHLRSNP